MSAENYESLVDHEQRIRKLEEHVKKLLALLESGELGCL
jgi:hypothetical protein